MALVGATQLDPVNVLGSYVQGMELGESMKARRLQQAERELAQRQEAQVNELIRANPNLRDVAIQNQLLGMGPAGREALQAGLNLEQVRGQLSQQDMQRQAARFNQYRDRLLPVANQQGWSTWRNQMLEAYGNEIPGLADMIPEQYSEQNKRNMFATSDSMVPMTEYQRRSIAVQEEQNRRLLAKMTADAGQAGMMSPPKLKQGERWNPEKQRVEAVEGSDIYIKQSGTHNKDYTALNAINNQRDLAVEKLDALLKEENKEAFSNLFGGYSAYATRELSGKTADLRSDLESLKNNLKAAGKKIIAGAGPGAIGQITEREWPILEGMIAELRPTMTEQGARDKLEEIKVFLNNLSQQAADEYQTNWGETQYYKTPKSGAPATPTPSGGGVGRFKITPIPQ